MSLSNIGSKISGLAGLGSGLAQLLLGPRRRGMNSELNVNKLVAEMGRKGGFYKPSLYVVKVVPKNPLKFFGNAISPTMPKDITKMGAEENFERQSMFLCNSVNLPGTQILANDHRRQNYGTYDRRPYNAQVTDTQLTFFVDNDGFVMNHFDEWSNAIVNKNASNGEDSIDPATGQNLFEIGYRDTYLCNIEIFCLTGDITAEQGFEANACLHYTLREAFPILTGDISLAWSETDAFSILPVQFHFRTYDVERLSIGKRDNIPFGNGMGIHEVLGIIAGVAGQVGSMGGQSKQAIIASGMNQLNNRVMLNSSARFY